MREIKAGPQHTSDELKELLAEPLEFKVQHSLRVIDAWYKAHDGNVFVAFSGGKDSTILLHLVRSIHPDVKAVFANTGLEYPEIMAFAKSHDNVDVVVPKKKFVQVLQEDGFPISNKQQARSISRLQNPTKRNFNTRRLALTGYAGTLGTWNKRSKVSNKWMAIAFSDVRVTDACCNHLKKDPVAGWKRNNPGFKSYVGMMFGEGATRDLKLNRRRCNAFDHGDPTSIPLKFWTDKDVYEYADANGVEICSVYKDFNLSRTGCTFCAYGAEMEDQSDNRFTKLRDSHPVQFNIFINKFGMNKALDYAGVSYGEKPTYSKPEMPDYTCSCCGGSFPVTRVGFAVEREWTVPEEAELNPTAGMDLWCRSCAISHDLPVIEEAPRNGKLNV